MPIQKQSAVLPRTLPKTVDHQNGATVQTSPPATTAAPATTTPTPPTTPPASVDGPGQANSFENHARTDFVAGQGQAVPTSTMGPMGARIQNLTGGTAPRSPDPTTVALEQLAVLVPSPASLVMGQPERLVALVRQAIAGADDGFCTLDTKALDAVLEPAWASGYQGYQAIADQLTALGFKANADGFTGVGFMLPDAGGVPAQSPAEFAADLAARLPRAPGDQAPGVKLGELVKHKIEQAVAKGETRIDLETNELDAILGRDVKYADVAKKLGELGYRASSDGFVGVWASWDDAPAATVTQADMLSALASAVSAPGAATASEQVVALLERKLAEASHRGGRRSVDLEPGEIDALLKPVFGSPSSGYGPLAAALQGAGYRAFADGFIGVSASWGG